MAEKKRLLWKRALWVLVAELFVITFLVPNAWIRRVNRVEQHLVRATLGGESADWIERAGSHWFQAAFIDTGFKTAVHDFFIPTKVEIQRSEGMDALGKNVIFPYLEGCIEGTFLSLQTVFLRMATACVWVPLVPLMTIPALLDGMIRWRIRQYSFAYASPLVHLAAMRGIAIIVCLTPGYLFLPLPLSPWIPLAGAALVALLLGAVAAHTQKRV